MKESKYLEHKISVKVNDQLFKCSRHFTGEDRLVYESNEYRRRPVAFKIEKMSWLRKDGSMTSKRSVSSGLIDMIYDNNYAMAQRFLTDEHFSMMISILEDEYDSDNGGYISVYQPKQSYFMHRVSAHKPDISNIDPRSSSVLGSKYNLIQHLVKSLTDKPDLDLSGGLDALQTQGATPDKTGLENFIQCFTHFSDGVADSLFSPYGASKCSAAMRLLCDPRPEANQILFDHKSVNQQQLNQLYIEISHYAQKQGNFLSNRSKSLIQQSKAVFEANLSGKRAAILTICQSAEIGVVGSIPYWFSRANKFPVNDRLFFHMLAIPGLSQDVLIRILDKINPHENKLLWMINSHLIFTALKAILMFDSYAEDRKFLFQTLLNLAQFGQVNCPTCPIYHSACATFFIDVAINNMDIKSYTDEMGYKLDLGSMRSLIGLLEKSGGITGLGFEQLRGLFDDSLLESDDLARLIDVGAKAELRHPRPSAPPLFEHEGDPQARDLKTSLDVGGGAFSPDLSLPMGQELSRAGVAAPMALKVREASLVEEAAMQPSAQAARAGAIAELEQALPLVPAHAPVLFPRAPSAPTQRDQASSEGLVNASVSSGQAV